MITSAGFHPKRPGDVLVSEQFTTQGDQLPAGLLAWIRQAGGFAGAGDARSSYINGLLHDMQGESDQALAAYLKAVDLLEKDRRRLRDGAARGTFLENKIEFYYTPVLHLLQRGRHGEAFDLLERSRSRVMSDLLASRTIAVGSPQTRRIYADLMKLQAKTASLQAELFLEKSRADREQRAEKIARAEQEIIRLEDERRKLLARMSREAPKMRFLVVSEPVSLKALQQRMKEDGSEAIEYLVLEHALILWHISGDAVHAVNVLFPRSELMKKVEALRSSLSRGNKPFDEQTSQELFLFMVQPVMKWIKGDHLIIIPHEDLNYIPFQVLQYPSDKRFLGERLRMTYAPSATILAGFRKVDISKKSLLAIANPEIVEASKEVQAIAKLYPGRSKVTDEYLAEEADVKKWAGEYDILHLSTHGTFDPPGPFTLLSHLEQGRMG